MENGNARRRMQMQDAGAAEKQATEEEKQDGSCQQNNNGDDPGWRTREQRWRDMKQIGVDGWPNGEMEMLLLGPRAVHNGPKLN